LASNPSEPDQRYPYVYLGHNVTADAVSNKTVIAYSPPAFTDGLGANVLFGDSHVLWVTAADLPAVLARGGPATRPATAPLVVQSTHG
jgi:prepilin-type processing-associated H-X9-DG protein